MKILAVDTSGMSGSVALSDNNTLIAARPLTAEGRRHAQTLVSEAARLLTEVDTKPAGIDVVAVSIGPGSFTGLRVGCVFAKTFAWANDASLVAVDTLQAFAVNSSISNGVIRVISDAQRREVFCRDYSAADRSPLTDLTIIPVADVGQTVGSDVMTVTGPGVRQFSELLPEALCSYVQSPEAVLLAPDVASLGAELAESGAVADIAALEPVYVRRSYAEENRDQT